MFDKSKYRKRIIDEKIERYLKLFPALSIEGPKHCGKTWTSKYHCKSEISFVDDDSLAMAKLSLDRALDGESPRLIDEWNYIPQVWDKVRNRCDNVGDNGQFILTCSTSLSSQERSEHIFHSGAGRFAPIRMRPMSLYESGDSSGQVSLGDLIRGNFNECAVDMPTLDQLAYYIIRGGWPKNITSSIEDAQEYVSVYSEYIISRELCRDKNRNSNIMRSVLKSLARQESTIAGAQTIADDIRNTDNLIDGSPDRRTISDYLDLLTRLHIIENQPPYSSNIRSPNNMRKTSVRRFVDPSLACCNSNTTIDSLIKDRERFGLLFESLVIRDLRVYLDALNGIQVSQYARRDGKKEVDAVLELKNGDIAAVEIKLSRTSIADAIKSLQKFEKETIRKPKYKIVIVGLGNLAYEDKESGTYIIPITALKH